jgi:hypothetical protein
MNSALRSSELPLLLDLLRLLRRCLGFLDDLRGLLAFDLLLEESDEEVSLSLELGSGDVCGLLFAFLRDDRARDGLLLVWLLLLRSDGLSDEDEELELEEGEE